MDKIKPMNSKQKLSMSKSYPMIYYRAANCDRYDDRDAGGGTRYLVLHTKVGLSIIR